MESAQRTLLPLTLGALPQDIHVPGFAQAYARHQLRNHESVLLILLRLAGWALVVAGVLLVLFAPRTVMVHALYGPTAWQQLLLMPQLPVIGGVLILGLVRLLAPALDRSPLSALEFFERFYLLKLDQRLADDLCVKIRYLGGDAFAVALQNRDTGTGVAEGD